MDTGIGFFSTHDAIGPGALARLVEEHGHAALYFPEHSHIPASRNTAFPGGGELPRKYAHTYDLFVALSAAATATSRLRIGSGICLVIQRDPIHTAKEVASVDHLSGGRRARDPRADHGRPCRCTRARALSAGRGRPRRALAAVSQPPARRACAGALRGRVRPDQRGLTAGSECGLP